MSSKDLRAALEAERDRRMRHGEVEIAGVLDVFLAEYPATPVTVTEWNIMRDDGTLVTRSNTWKPAILTKLNLMQTEGRIDVRLVQREAAGPWADDDA